MTQTRRYLFLQGPHGPFFAGLARLLRAAGGQVWRVGVNGGDRAFWPDKDSYIPFDGTIEDWPTRLRDLIERHEITDLVLYGDTRPFHARALDVARDKSLRIHVFEEGYLRPWWVSYERDGANGHSRLMDKTVADMRAALDRLDLDQPDPPAHWGDMRQHIFYGALYHFHVLRGRKPGIATHRDLPVWAEFRLHLTRLLKIPATALIRRIRTARIIGSGHPYHLCLLQLEHDASVTAHSSFASMTAFIETVITAFAEGAPRHHHLILKAHPLEDGRAPLAAHARNLTRQYGLTGRVHFLPGGKLAPLMDQARSAVTINSTAAQQALWRGIPVKALGRAVYSKPEFVSEQPLAAFFADPQRPDARAYRDYRHYLLETSQIPGGFYAARGRRQLLRQVVDMILSDQDPYDHLDAGRPALRQRLKLVSG
ncbi:MAG: capsule biosynthesis protein CapA [Pseudomonadota bacterium]